MKNKKTFAIATLGCRTNQYESAAYAKQLRELGYCEAQEGDEADVCIVNTCTVTEGADRSSRHQIRQLRRQHPRAKVVVTGCLADRLPKELEGMEEVDHVVLNKDKEGLLKQVLPIESLPEFAIDQFGGHTRAFVKVQDGCNSFCTYCIIPYVRGRSRSREVDAILKEVGTLVAQGYQEIVLTGINVGDFDGSGKTLAELVSLVDQIDGVKRLRISSIDPDEVDESLLDAVINGQNTCHSMHIVLQSGSNAILKKMNRKYTRQMFIEAVETLKKASKDFTFTTDVIVGFPGESEGDFEQTLEVMRQVQFAKVHMFPYSRREKTRAALYPNQVAQAIINERKQVLLRLAEQMSFELRSQYVGRKMSVLLESQEGAYFTGHTDNFLEVLVKDTNLSSNQIILVECLENRPEGLIACLSKSP